MSKDSKALINEIVHLVSEHEHGNIGAVIDALAIIAASMATKKPTEEVVALRRKVVEQFEGRYHHFLYVSEICKL